MTWRGPLPSAATRPARPGLVGCTIFVLRFRPSARGIRRTPQPGVPASWDPAIGTYVKRRSRSPFDICSPTADPAYGTLLMCSASILAISRTWSRPPYQAYGPPVYLWDSSSIEASPPSLVSSITRPRSW
jgi:hypothetical protein